MATTEDTFGADEYDAWLVARHAAAAREMAQKVRAGTMPTAGDLVALLNNLAAIAEREAN